MESLDSGVEMLKATRSTWDGHCQAYCLLGLSLGGGAGSIAFTLPQAGLVGSHSLPSSPLPLCPSRSGVWGERLSLTPQIELALLLSAHSTSFSPLICSFIFHPFSKYLSKCL